MPPMDPMLYATCVRKLRKGLLHSLLGDENASIADKQIPLTRLHVMVHLDTREAAMPALNAARAFAISTQSFSPSPPVGRTNRGAARSWEVVLGSEEALLGDAHDMAPASDPNPPDKSSNGPGNELTAGSVPPSISPSVTPSLAPAQSCWCVVKTDGPVVGWR